MDVTEQLYQRYVVPSYKHDIRFIPPRRNENEYEYDDDNDRPDLEPGAYDTAVAKKKTKRRARSDEEQCPADDHCVRAAHHLVESIQTECQSKSIKYVWHDGLTAPWRHTPHHKCFGLFAYLNPGARVLLDIPRPRTDVPVPSEWLHHEFVEAMKLLYLVAQLEIDFRSFQSAQVVRIRNRAQPPSVAWGSFNSAWLLAESLCARLNGNFTSTAHSETRLATFVQELAYVDVFADCLIHGTVQNLDVASVCDQVKLIEAQAEIRQTIQDVQEYCAIMTATTLPDAGKLVHFFSEKLHDARCYNPGDKLLLGILSLYLTVAVAGEHRSPVTAMTEFINHTDPFVFAVMRLVQSPYMLHAGFSTKQQRQHFLNVVVKLGVHNVMASYDTIDKILDDIPPGQVSGGFAGHLTGSGWKQKAFQALQDGMGFGHEIAAGKEARLQWEAANGGEQVIRQRHDTWKWQLRRRWWCCKPFAERVLPGAFFDIAPDSLRNDIQVMMADAILKPPLELEPMASERPEKMRQSMQTALQKLVPIVSEDFPAAKHDNLLLFYAMDRQDCGSWAYPKDKDDNGILELGYNDGGVYTVAHSNTSHMTQIGPMVQMAVVMSTETVGTVQIVMFRHVKSAKPIVHSPCRPEELLAAEPKSAAGGFSSYSLINDRLCDNLGAYQMSTRSPWMPEIADAIAHVWKSVWDHPWTVVLPDNHDPIARPVDTPATAGRTRQQRQRPVPEVSPGGRDGSPPDDSPLLHADDAVRNAAKRDNNNHNANTNNNSARNIFGPDVIFAEAYPADQSFILPLLEIVNNNAASIIIIIIVTALHILETRTKHKQRVIFGPSLFLSVCCRGRCRAVIVAVAWRWTTMMMMGHCGKLLLFLLPCFLFSLPAGVMSSTSKKGQHHRRRPAADLLLKMHELYTRQPPHDTSLYDLLEVSPNATYAEIAKSYRQITRRLHPDKQVGRRRRRKKEGGLNYVVGTDNTNENDDDRPPPVDQKLARVRAAYEILKHDSRRLPYHRHGLLNPMDAVYILTGKHNSVGGGPQPYPRRVLAVDNDDDHNDEHEKDVLQMELLELMGYYHYHDHHHYQRRKKFPFFSDQQRPSSSSGDYHHHHHEQQRSKRDRVHFIAASLLERLVPVIEGSLPEHVFLDHLIQQCDRWKSLPLGAQIVRCIGRAYRYEGERFLRQGMPLASVQDGMRSMMRQAKYFAHAAVAGGRVVLEERKVVAAAAQQQTQTTSSSPPPHPAIHDRRPVQHWEDDDDMAAETELLLSGETIHKQELDQAHQAVLESLQVEALWKICKIDLDRTIRTACHVLLDGPPPTATTSTTTGWIGQKNGNAVMAHHGRIQLALLLVRMGNIMVHRSKEGTAWMD